MWYIATLELVEMHSSQINTAFGGNPVEIRNKSKGLLKCVKGSSEKYLNIKNK